MKPTDCGNHQAVGRDLVDAISLLLQEARLCGNSPDGRARGDKLYNKACELADRLVGCFPGESRSVRSQMLKELDEHKAQVMRNAPWPSK